MKPRNRKKREENRKEWVVIPAHNEEGRIGRLIRAIKKEAPEVKILVCNDNSKDNTEEEARNEGVEVISEKNKKSNKGKGKGYISRKGCDYAVKKGAEKIVLMDGDLQHSPKDLKKIMSNIREGTLVIGRREWNKKMPLKAKFGNFGIHTAFKMIFLTGVKDSQSGYRGFTAKDYDKIRWEANDYFMETEMIIKALRKKVKIEQPLIRTIYLDSDKGTSWSHGVKILLNMVRWRFKRV